MSSSPSPSPSPSAVPPPPYAGMTLPLTSSETDPPLLQLVRKLYQVKTPDGGSTAGPQDAASKPLTFYGYDHDCRILCEPFGNQKGAMTRPCLMGSSCQGKSRLLPGHAEASVDGENGVILTEMISPDELNAFYETGELPAERRCCLLCARYNIHMAYLHTRKSKTFPSNALLNNFVNGHGEHQYDKSFLIPGEDETTWTGIVGTVVGCHINALRLYKDEAANLWRVDQTALKHVVASSLNNTTPLLYRGYGLSPQAWLKQFFQYRHRVHDTAILFNDFDDLDSVKPKIDFDNLSNTSFLQWPEGTVKSFIHRLLYYRINRLNTLFLECRGLYGAEWSFNMQLYIDAHVPMVHIFEEHDKVNNFTLKYPAYEDTLPDFTLFLNQAVQNVIVPAGLSASERKKRVGKSRAVLISLLIRVLPEYSQNKSLHNLFIKALQHKDLSTKLFQIFQCVILNNFRPAAARGTVPSRELDSASAGAQPWPYTVRKQFLTQFTEDRLKKTVAELPDSEHVSMYVLRSYLQLVLPLCPPLQQFIIHISPLQKQIEKVATSLRMMRQYGSSDWTKVFSTEVLDLLKKNHKRLPKKKLVKRGVLDMSDSLRTVVTKTCSRRGLKRTAGVFDFEMVNTVFKKARMGDDCGAVGAIGCDPDLLQPAVDTFLGALATSNKPTELLDRETIDDATLEKLSDFAIAFDGGTLFKLVSLPEDVADMQLAALAKRFNCEPDDWDTLRRATSVKLCIKCGIRNFTLQNVERFPKNTYSRRMSNQQSAGFKKLAYDVDTGSLRCVETPHCSHLDMQTIDLLQRDPATGKLKGGVLVLRKETAMISPCCGHLCATSAVRFANSTFDCPACCETKRAVAEELLDPRVCAYCQKRSQLKQSLSQIVYLRDAKGRVKSHGFCKTHFRPWARLQSGYLAFEFVSLNMQNRSGAGLVFDGH